MGQIWGPLAVGVHVGGVPWTRCVGVCIAVEAELTVAPDTRNVEKSFYERVEAGLITRRSSLNPNYSREIYLF
jgi:hypothetical protein